MKAFKDWSYIVHALGTGKQTIILRKGGIHEDSGKFQIEANEFLLLPTLFHQANDKVKRQSLVDFKEEIYNPNHLTANIHYLAKLEQFVEVEDNSTLERLDKFHVWTEEVVMERFNRWNPNKVFCLVLRVYELDQPIQIEMTPELAGCKSWVDLEVETGNYRPVLDEQNFNNITEELQDLLKLG